MTPELKQKWIEALRSGKYTQTTGRLRSMAYPDNQPQPAAASFCCLGVLCEVVDPLGWVGTEWNYQDDRHNKNLPDRFRTAIEMTPEQETWLIRMNDDDQFSFEQIAAVIEREL
jgi:hypothetical protein